MAEVGSAFVSILPSTKGFGTQLNSQVGGDLDSSGSQMGKRLGSAIKVGALAMIGGLVVGGKFLAGAISQASDLNETVSKTKVVFGGASKEVLKFANQGAAKLGQTRQEILDAAGTFGTFGKAAGLQGPELARFSTGLSSLSTDLSSFFNTDTKSAADALGAALRGEGEPMRAYGVLLDDATLKAEALRLGLLKPVKDQSKILGYQTAVTIAQNDYNQAVAKTGKGSITSLKAQAKLGNAQTTLQKATEGTIPPLTQQQKVLAAQSSIMKQTKDAQGDFARTSGGLANQQRILGASVTDVKTKLGALFLPTAIKVVSFINRSVVPTVERFVRQLKNGKGAGGEVAAKFASVSAALKGVPWKKYGTEIGTALAPVRDALKNLPWKQFGNDVKSIDFTSLKAKIAGIDFKKIGAEIRSLDFAALKKRLSDIDFGKISKSVKSIDFGAIKKSLGSGVNDTISVFGVVIGFAADHAQTLAKHLPLLVGAFIAYKSAQALANVAAIAALPITLLNSAAMVLNASANRALATQIAITNGVEKVGLLTRARATVATVASTIASKAASIATKVWAAGQWLLNAALTANPIGLVVAAIALLVVGFIYAWKHSEKFRAVIMAVFDKIKSVINGAVTKSVEFLRKIGAAFTGLVHDVGQFLSGVKSKLGRAVDFVAGLPGRMLDALGDLGGTLKDAGMNLIQGLLDGITDKFDDLKGLLGNVTDLIPEWKGPPSRDAILLQPAGQSIMGGLIGGIDQKRKDLRASLRDVTTDIASVAANMKVDGRSGAATAGAGVGGPGGVQIHVENMAPHDYRAFMGDMQRRTQRASIGGFA